LLRFFGVNYFFYLFNSLSQRKIITAQMARTVLTGNLCRR
jgi:hypothetical protein